MTNDKFSMTDFQSFQWLKPFPHREAPKKVKCTPFHTLCAWRFDNAPGLVSLIETEHKSMKTLRTCFYWLFAAAFAMTATLLLAKPPLQEGDMAPLVSGHDQDGNSWNLNSKFGKEIVLLYFYPKDDTQGCTAEACGLRDKMNGFKQRDVEVVGVSFDNAESHQRFVFKYNLNFPLLADTKGEIADAYGVRLGPDKKMARRVSFLIGLNGRIVHITDSPDAAVHLREMQAAIAHLEGKPTP
jgi:peroxiredoxin Q/BCP